MNCSHNLGRSAGRYLRYVFLVTLMLTVIPARAASVSFFLDQSNVLPDGTNYLSVMLTENGAGGVDFLVQTLSPLNNVAGRNFGIQYFGFSFLDDAWGSISNLTSGWRVLSGDGWHGHGNRQMSEFRKFDVLLQTKGKNRTDELSFTVNGVTLDDFGSSLMAAHVAGFEWCRTDERSYSWCGDRFCPTSAYFAGQMGSLPPPNPSAVPLPAAAWLFGTGLLGLAGIARRRKPSSPLLASFNSTAV